jgi:hypothetical protein
MTGSPEKSAVANSYVEKHNQSTGQHMQIGWAQQWRPDQSERL